MDTTDTLQAEEGARAASWVAVGALAVVVALLNAAEQLPASLLTPMAAGLDATEGLIGQSVTATAIFAIAASLLTAPMTRRIDRRPVLLALTAVLVASSLVVALAPSTAIMLTARLLLGLSVGGVWGLSASLALRLVPVSDVPKALAVIFGGGSVAMVAAPALGAFFGGIIGWRGVFVGLTMLSAIALVALLFALPSMPSQSASSGTGLATALTQPGLALGLVGVMLMFGGGQTFQTYVRPFLEEVSGMMTGQVSLTLFIFGVTSLFGTMAAPRLLGRISIRAILAGAAFAEVASLLALLATGGSMVAAMGCVGLWGFFLDMVAVSWSTWVTRTYPDHAEPAGGILVAAIQGSMMLGALVGGGLIDNLSVVAPLVASIVILAVAALYVWGVLDRQGTSKVEAPA